MLSPWDPDQHLGMVQNWAKARDVDLRVEDLPRIGFLANGAAVGWLYQTDSGVGYLETFITNPNVSPRERARAVDEVATALIHQARGLGLTKLVSMTGHRSIGRMAIRHGFAYAGPMHVLRMEV